MVTYTDDSDLDDGDIMMPQLIYLDKSDDEEYNPRESLRDPPSADPTSEPIPTREKTNKELTSEPDYDVMSEPSVPKRDCSMDNLSPGYIYIIST